jgi:hypothetical protein
MQEPLHSTRPPPQLDAQTPLLQELLEQTTPQSPQLKTSNARSVQYPPQSVRPFGQPGWAQTPPRHERPSTQQHSVSSPQGTPSPEQQPPPAQVPPQQPAPLEQGCPAASQQTPPKQA